MAEQLAKGVRIVGAQRTQLVAEVAARYAAGESIRAIAESTGRSFGFVHGLVSESGTPVRSRGGATRGPARADAGSADTTAATSTRARTADAGGTAKKAKKDKPAADAKAKKGAGKDKGRVRKGK